MSSLPTTLTVEQVLSQIKAEKAQLDSNKNDRILHLLRLGKQFVQLKTLARGGRWIKLVMELGFDRRVASRLLNLGYSQWDEQSLKDSGVLAKLPGDLIKLEQLCKLSFDDLGLYLRVNDPTSEDRGKVIANVHRLLGITTRVEAPKPISGETFEKICASSFDRILDAIEQWDEDGGDVRQRMLDMIEKKVDELLTAYETKHLPTTETTTTEGGQSGAPLAQPASSSTDEESGGVEEDDITEDQDPSVENADVIPLRPGRDRAAA